MSTFNMNIDMGPEEAVDALNGYFEKVATWFVGDMEPEIKLPGLIWIDSYNKVTKQRNLENTGWIVRASWSGSWGLPIGMAFPSTIVLDNVPGFIAATGALLNREEWPVFWQHVESGGNIVTDSVWNSQQRYYSYSRGNGSTTFRIPRIYDFVRGLGTGTMGQWRQDQMQRITGYITNVITRTAASGGAFTNERVMDDEFASDTLGGRERFNFDSANSPNARTSSTTSGETWPCHGTLPYYIYTGEVW